MNGARRPYTARGDSETTAYLGYRLEVTANEVIVSAPVWRPIGRATSVKQARLLIRSYRRGERA